MLGFLQEHGFRDLQALAGCQGGIANAETTDESMSRLLNCTGDKFTATWTACDQPAASMQACVALKRQSRTISPVSSQAYNVERRNYAASWVARAEQGLHGSAASKIRSARFRAARKSISSNWRACARESIPASKKQ
jgi:hypothetical protein